MVFYCKYTSEDWLGTHHPAPKIHLATEEDRAYNTDEWAMLFKAKNWKKK